MVSVLLGQVDKPIFEILYRSAYRAIIHLEPNITLRQFITRVVRLAKAEKLKVEPINPAEGLFLVENMVWLVIISTDQNPHTVKQEFLSRLRLTSDVKGAFILTCSVPPRWSWAQVSQGARMKAQASKQTISEKGDLS